MMPITEAMSTGVTTSLRKASRFTARMVAMTTRTRALRSIRGWDWKRDCMPTSRAVMEENGGPASSGKLLLNAMVLPELALVNVSSLYDYEREDLSQMTDVMMSSL
mmetsp:Transcript_29146/g.62764  ORF Transcript_29146/g.62764 Transcript_29146/m.62764 type:complete len:106 (+) Transcript_29146:2240-2557(+)